jgi:SEC-C motif
MGVNKQHGINDMARPLPKSSDQWLTEIRLAWKDARETKSFAHMTGSNVTDADLFHLAPLVCLKFRGREITGKEADKVTKGALANYVVNTGPDAKVQGLESNPKMAFALCYVAAHLILDLVDEQTAGEILDFCEGRLTGEMAADVAKAKLPILPSSRPSLPRNPEIKQKVGRNDPCPCGSGKKFKTCCMRV